ncbi:MAG: hypothetical protein AAF772_19825 [Acidobacteriota bacterium]
MRHDRSSLFTLLLCCGLAAPSLAAGPDPYADARDEIDRVGTALFAWLIDSAEAVNAPSSSADPARLTPTAVVAGGAGTIDVGAIPVISAQDLAALLVPTYLDAVPVDDPWGAPYEYRLAADPQLALDPFAIRAGGPDQQLAASTAYVGGRVDAVDDDLVWLRGIFVRRFIASGLEARTTQDDLARIGAAMDSYIAFTFGVDARSLPAPASARRSPVGTGAIGGAFCPGVDFAMAAVTAAPTPYADVAADLVPLYLPWLPDADGWNTPYDLRWNPNAILSFAPLYAALRSAGADAQFDGDVYTGGTVAAPADDLVWQNGVFHRGLAPDPADAFPLLDRDIRRIDQAMVAYLTDLVGADAPLERRASAGASVYNVTNVPVIDTAALEIELVPFYLPCLPSTDRWGSAYEYRFNLANPLAPTVYVIRSPGSDGAFEGPVYRVGPVPAGEPDEDLVRADLFWVRNPEPAMLSSDDFERGDLSDWSAVTP